MITGSPRRVIFCRAGTAECRSVGRLVGRSVGSGHVERNTEGTGHCPGQQSARETELDKSELSAMMASMTR